MMTAPCGTNAAFQRHYRNGEEPCQPCKDARRERGREANRNLTPAQKARKAQQEADYRAALVELRRRNPSEYLRILYQIRSDRENSK